MKSWVCLSLSEMWLWDCVGFPHSCSINALTVLKHLNLLLDVSTSLPPYISALRLPTLRLEQPPSLGARWGSASPAAMSDWSFKVSSQTPNALWLIKTPGPHDQEAASGWASAVCACAVWSSATGGRACSVYNAPWEIRGVMLSVWVSSCVWTEEKCQAAGVDG